MPEIEVGHADDTVVVTVGRGRLDAASAPHLYRRVVDSLAAGTPVVLDLAAVSFADSEGLELIMALRRRHPGLGLRAVQPQVQLLLTLARLRGKGGAP